MRIAVIGSGYVGLVAGTCFAESGNLVTCVDVDESKIRSLAEGRVPIYEPGLEELIRRNAHEERLFFTTDGPRAVRESEVVFITVGTPPGPDGAADLSYVFAAAEMIGRHMDGYRVIVDKSTVPVGTADRVREVVARHTRHEFDVVSNPEFLKEGAAIDDFMKPDRVVIGATSRRAADIMKDLYDPFVRTGKPIMVMDVRSSELTKYAANAMLAARISFMNEIANLCERLGANVDDVRRGIGSDSRIGFPFLFPGVGYGGSCFPKDVQALIRTAEAAGCDLRILRAVEEVNQRQKHVLVDKVVRLFGESLRGRTFAVWGLAFKPNTDDMREAPSLAVIPELVARGARVRATDPEAIGEARRHLPASVEYCEKNLDTLDGADALLIITEWNEYRRPDYRLMKERMRSPVILDGRNIYNPARMAELGFSYYGIGLPEPAKPA